MYDLRKVTAWCRQNPSVYDWMPAQLVKEVLEMKEMLISKGLTGPFIIRYSLKWEMYMQYDYAESLTQMGVDRTVIERLREVVGIQDVEVDRSRKPEVLGEFWLTLQPVEN